MSGSKTSAYSPPSRAHGSNRERTRWDRGFKSASPNWGLFRGGAKSGAAFKTSWVEGAFTTTLAAYFYISINLFLELFLYAPNKFKMTHYYSKPNYITYIALIFQICCPLLGLRCTSYTKPATQQPVAYPERHLLCRCCFFGLSG